MLAKKNINSFPSSIYYILAIFIVGLIVFSKTFQLSIMGDEWQMIWVIRGSLETTGQWDSGIKQFNWQGYQFGALIMYLLTNYFGYDGKAVYIFSFITRFLATLALFYFLRKRGSFNKVAFLGSLFFILSPIGLQATDWAKNFTSYISIIFFLLCINLIYNLKSWKNVLIFPLFLSISIFVNPIRVHGIVLTIAALLFIQLLFNKSLVKKNIIVVFFSSILMVFLLSKVLIYSEVGSVQDYYNQKLILLLSQIFSGNWSRLNDLFTLIGRGILPHPGIVYTSLLLIILLIWKGYLLNKKFIFFTLIVHLVFILFFLNFFSTSSDKMTAFLGIYFSVFMITTFIVELFKGNSTEATDTILPFLLNTCFVFAPWVLGNTDVTQSTHRYLIYPALSLPIIIAFSLNKNLIFKLEKKSSMASIASMGATLILLLTIFLSMREEINNLYARHNQETAKVVWQQITPFFDSYDFKNHRPIILFESDNATMLHDTVLFGMDYRLGIIYKVWEENKLPIPVDGLQTLKSMLIDGKASKRYTGKEIVFPREDAFYFQINSDKVKRIDIQTLFTDNQP